VARIKVSPDLDVAVRFDGAGIRLPRRQRRAGARRRQRLRRIAGEVARDEVWFLRDASFSVERGQALALVGHQGSGHDQVLRLAAGTLMPDEGAVERGLMFVPIIGLGAALHRSYTVRQNIYLIGGLLGMLPDQVGEKLPEIVEMAGVAKILDKFLGDTNRVVRGRLVWSIAMATGAAGFAINGALIVGQPAFQKQCWTIVEELKAEGVTFLVTSDRASHLSRFCDRALLLDSGTITLDGTVEEALEGLKLIKPPKDQVHFVVEDDDDFDDDEMV
jgi:ABC-2 type transport system ATP-binding protein